MKKPRLYQRLASAHQFGVVNGGWVSLHLAVDHLLLRNSSGFAENYRRFYFADIEAISVCTTIRGLIWNSVWGFGLFFSVLPMLMNWRLHPVAATFASLFVLLLGANISLGPTCVTQLQTRVQNRKLPLRRTRKALRVVAQLSAKIETAQAQLFAAAAPAPAQVTPLAPVAPSVPPPLPGREQTRRPSLVHAATFGLLIVGGLVAIWAALQHQLLLSYFSYTAVVLNLGLGIAALVQQRRKRLPARPALLVWISVIAHAVALPTVYMVFSFVYAFQMALKPAAARGMPPAQLGLAALRDMPGFQNVLLIYGAFCLLLGLLGGIVMLTMPRRTEGPASA